MAMYRSVESFAGPGRLLRLEGAGDALLLTHGTFSNAETMLPLATYFAGLGYDVYVVEWRGRDGAPPPFGFYDLAEGEIAEALRTIGRPCHVMAHSGGGLAMCLALMEPELRALVRSITLIATQGTHLTEAAFLPYWNIRFLSAFALCLGHWPKQLPGLGPCHESAQLLAQWVGFNRARRVVTREGASLYPALGTLGLPAFAVAGAGDTVIARPDGCRALAEAFGATGRYHLCDAVSDGEDFSHSRLIRSQGAKARVRPRIAAFLAEVEAGDSRAL